VTYAPPDLFVAIEDFRPLPEALYEAGVWCVTTPLRRENPQAKSTAFIEVAAGVYDALPPGAHEALMRAEDGALLEGLSSNFFAVLRGALHTENDRVLPGLTRRLVLEAAQDVLPCVPRAIRLTEVAEASECLLTSASREVLPVVRIDDVVVGDGRPGPVARELLKRYRDTVWREARRVFE
jgi:branched-subunit amino acid aminotransferase/4-amino-4-deoxychorismate lyase